MIQCFKFPGMPSNERLERTGGEAGCDVQAWVAAGRSAARR
mgnify:CR=1 FL=1